MMMKPELPDYMRDMEIENALKRMLPNDVDKIDEVHRKVEVRSVKPS